MKCALVGLPNVGKSTLFNVLVGKANADAQNFPFCTIEPNIAVLAVEDTRLSKLAQLSKSAKTIPASLEFVDVAGLIGGASKGEGLGNKFLGDIRQTDLIIHLVRAFEDENVIHVLGSPSPTRDMEIINTELILADIQTLTKRLESLAKLAKGGDKQAKQSVAVGEQLAKLLDQAKPARLLEDIQTTEFADLLITAKPLIYVANTDEKALKAGSNPMTQQVADQASKENTQAFNLAVALEAELLELATDERTRLLKEEGITSSLGAIVKGGYDKLGLITFFTSGEKETRAWTIPQGTTAPEAAGKIHTDFERGFICAETIGYEDFIASGGTHAAKQQGLLRQEGRSYIVRDGDVMHFRFNV